MPLHSTANSDTSSHRLTPSYGFTSHTHTHTHTHSPSQHARHADVDTGFRVKGHVVNNPGRVGSQVTVLDP